MEQTSPNSRTIRIGMVAGEISGDILGSGLMRALKQRYPNAVFEGIGGPQMLAEGFNSHVPMERLSVMGLVEVLGRIFELIGIRRRLRDYFLENPPEVFIGIDAPDFTLGLEGALHAQGIPTVHYVSPSVWAWRQKRIFKIARSVDLMLTLFPFEARFYEEHKVPVRFVGHPLADLIPMQPSKQEARHALGVGQAATGNNECLYVGLLPGSRGGEIHYLGEVFIEAARRIYAQQPNVQFLLPYVNEARKSQISEIISRLGQGLPIHLVDGRSREVMAASDVILLASGTATLEAMLMKRPMVVAYRMAALTYFLMKRLIRVPYVALPNLLAGKALVPELIQAQASPVNLANAVLERLTNESRQQAISAQFSEIHKQLRRGASEQAADAVANLIEMRMTETKSVVHS